MCKSGRAASRFLSALRQIAVVTLSKTVYNRAGKTLDRGLFCENRNRKKKGVSPDMKITKAAAAGTMESSDVYVEIQPADQISVQIESVVFQQFGQQIDQVVRQVLADHGVAGASVSLNDKGAVECVIRARVETALKRAEGGEN